MTREEALDSIDIEYDVEGYEIPDESLTSFTDTISLVSKIYNYFESKTCGNCIAWSCELHCEELDIVTDEDFGCNWWIIKENK